MSFGDVCRHIYRLLSYLMVIDFILQDSPENFTTYFYKYCLVNSTEQQFTMKILGAIQSEFLG